jgi:hypothetical protein
MADTVLATLVPENAPAKIGFSEAVDELRHSSSLLSYLNYILLNPTKVEEPEVEGYLTIGRGDAARSFPIWTGHFLFNLEHPPRDKKSGWTGGKCTTKPELISCSRIQQTSKFGSDISHFTLIFVLACFGSFRIVPKVEPVPYW